MERGEARGWVGHVAARQGIYQLDTYRPHP